MATRECVYLVTGNFTSDHVTKMVVMHEAMRATVAENPMLRAHFTALWVTDAELL